MDDKKSQQNAIQRFREYIRIKTVHPNPDYDEVIKFLKAYAMELDLPVQEITAGTNTVLVMTWKGRKPEMKSIFLNSHTDVVPVYEDQWKYDAFEAVREENGDIYGRGTQDMKSVGIQYLEAIRILKVVEKRSFDRTIHLTFMPDEEIGGTNGMKLFIETPQFKQLNLGFSLDEGLANVEDQYSVYYGERSVWWLRITCRGDPGHGSRFIKNTAAEKLQSIINSFMEFRGQEEAKLEAGKCLLLGDVTTVNLTKLEGGIQHNVVPNEFKAGFDIRIAPTVDMEKFEARIKSWCEKAGADVTYEFVFKSINTKTTSTSKDDMWFKAFSGALDKIDAKYNVAIFSGATDSRFLREAGFPAIGFSPMKNTPVLLHDHNEFLNENVFLDGISVYTRIIPAIANCC